MTECQKEHQTNLRSLQQSLNRYVPRCAADGSYEQVQCAGGVCYCVTPQGKQIPGSSTYNSARQPNCTHPGKSILLPNFTRFFVCQHLIPVFKNITGRGLLFQRLQRCLLKFCRYKETQARFNTDKFEKVQINTGLLSQECSNLSLML